MSRRWPIAIALGLSAAVASEAASRFIALRFPDRPSAPDLFYDWLPHTPAASYVTLIAMTVMLALFLAHVVRTAPDRLPEYLCVFALMYLLRAPMLVLTPLAAARDGSAIPFPLFVNTLFPSGHTALALLIVLFTDAGRTPRLRTVQAWLLGVVIVTMLFSRGHYSIDIVGGLLLGYFVSREWAEGQLFGRLRRAVTAPTTAR
ncbi:MAG: phosphatase PAP2-related protein [Coriobacteriia bacterium]|nr:phosphatase PAP2-related protein [Coriobacteriia bacterium]